MLLLLKILGSVVGCLYADSVSEADLKLSLLCYHLMET